MKLCIIGNEGDLSTRNLYEESKKFKEISKSLLISLPKLYIDGYEKVMYRNKDISDYDACILYAPPSAFPFTYMIASILSKNKVALSHDPKSIIYMHNRGLLTKALARAKVNFPKTYLTLSPEVGKSIVNQFNKIVFKLTGTHGGMGVMIVKRKATARSIIDTMHSTSKSFYMQEVVKGPVVKLLVLGEEVIGVKETPKPGEDLSNKMQKRVSIRPSDELSEIGRKVAKEIGSLCCEIDVMGDEGNYNVIDASINPSFRLYERVSGKNIANIMLNALLEKKIKVLATWERKLWKKLSKLLPLPPHGIY